MIHEPVVSWSSNCLRLLWIHGKYMLVWKLSCCFHAALSYSAKCIAMLWLRVFQIFCDSHDSHQMHMSMNNIRICIYIYANLCFKNIYIHTYNIYTHVYLSCKKRCNKRVVRCFPFAGLSRWSSCPCCQWPLELWHRDLCQENSAAGRYISNEACFSRCWFHILFFMFTSYFGKMNLIWLYNIF